MKNGAIALYFPSQLFSKKTRPPKLVAVYSQLFEQQCVGEHFMKSGNAASVSWRHQYFNYSFKVCGVWCAAVVVSFGYRTIELSKESTFR